ncbi:MAG: ArsR/SmtB family transcription factor [Acidobacteriota bacterium]
MPGRPRRTASPGCPAGPELWDELCLCQIIEVLGLAPATVSRHMSVLQAARLVQRRERGKWHFYGLAEGPAGSAVRRALGWVLSALRGDRPIARDARKIRASRKQDLERLSTC